MICKYNRIIGTIVDKLRRNAGIKHFSFLNLAIFKMYWESGIDLEIIAEPNSTTENFP